MADWLKQDRHIITHRKKNLLVVSMVMVVNALSYGTIIPLLYPYASRFGITASGMSLLFASYSLAQFITTPVIGRLSDKYGRKPLLLISLFGTGLSLALFASAGSALVLFLARILDGLTGGNVSVAQAVIADTTTGKDRAKSFGIIGAAFGFGFVFGPAIGGLLSVIDLTFPFWFASVTAVVATVAAWFFLDETNTHRETKAFPKQLFDFNSLLKALFTPITGPILMVSFVSLIAHNAMIIGFQSHTIDILGLTPQRLGLLFAGFGIINVLMQGFGLRILLDYFQNKRPLIRLSLLSASVAMAIIGIFGDTGFVFIGFILFFGLAIAPVSPLLTSMLSERVKTEDQGGILGLNQAYTSLSQIIGPLIAGLLVAFSTRHVFAFSALILALAIIPTLKWQSSKVKLDL